MNLKTKKLDIDFVDKNFSFREARELKRLTTFFTNKEEPIHRWYKYLQGFSKGLVEKMLLKLEVGKSEVVLDPFCGVGTTALTCKQNGINSVAIDISPLCVFITRVKTRDYKNPKKMQDDIINALKRAEKSEEEIDLSTYDYLDKAIPKEKQRAIFRIKKELSKIKDNKTRDFALMTLISSLEDISLIRKDGAHYRYVKEPREKDIFKHFKKRLDESLSDLKVQQTKLVPSPKLGKVKVLLGDARNMPLSKGSIDTIITSPPYLNRDNYIAQNKLELFVGGFVKDFREYRDLTRRTLQSHVEADGVGKLETFTFIEELIEKVEERGTYFPRIVDMLRGYYSDMSKFFKNANRVMFCGGRAAIVVGNSTWSGVHFETDALLSKIAEINGFTVKEILVTRNKLNSAQQISKFGKQKTRESVIILHRD